MAGQGEKGEYMTAFRDSCGRYLMVYFPVGKSATIRTTDLRCKKIRFWWFNPRTGKTEVSWKTGNSGAVTVTPPSTLESHDWVLVADNGTSRFRKPGRK